jgi:hypothetical protein
MRANISSNYLLLEYILSIVLVSPTILILNWLALIRLPCIGLSIYYVNLSFL